MSYHHRYFPHFGGVTLRAESFQTYPYNLEDYEASKLSSPLTSAPGSSPLTAAPLSRSCHRIVVNYVVEVVNYDNVMGIVVNYDNVMGT